MNIHLMCQNPLIRLSCLATVLEKHSPPSDVVGLTDVILVKYNASITSHIDFTTSGPTAKNRKKGGYIANIDH